MPLRLTRVIYGELNARQQENYNFCRLSAVMAEFGFVSLRLSDDCKGADFLAQHVDGETLLRVQLKGRLDFRKEYRGKNLHIAFCCDGHWYLYPHDQLLRKVLRQTTIRKTVSWKERGGYSVRRPGKKMQALLKPYEIPNQLH